MGAGAGHRAGVIHGIQKTAAASGVPGGCFLISGLYYSQIKPSCSITDRQVTLRSLTAFSLIASRYGNVGGFQTGKRNSRASAPFRFQTFRLASSPTGRARLQSPKPLAWDRSLPPAVREAGRRSVGNRKECRLRHDYASFPGPQTPSTLRAYGSFLSEISISPRPAARHSRARRCGP